MAKKKKVQINRESKEFDWAIEVADRVELKDVRQLQGNFRLETLDTEGEKSFSIIPTTEANLDKKNKKLLCFISFSIDTSVIKTKKQRPLACFESKYILVYDVKSTEGLTAKNYNAFAKFNGVFNAWPYLREFMQTSTARLVLPPLVLPTYRYGMEFQKPNLPSTSSKKRITKKK